MIKTEDKLTAQKTHIHIFGTSINSNSKAQKVYDELYKMKAIKSVNVDLDDWENVLRIECHLPFQSDKLKAMIHALGFTCYILPDIM